MEYNRPMQKDLNHQTSNLIIIYELILGTFEVVFGVGLLFLWNTLLSLYYQMSSGELLEDSNDLIVRSIEQVLPHLFAHRYYIALLLVALGVVKISSGIGMYYKKEWANHLLVALLVVLIPFDISEMIIHFSVFDLGYLLIDILIVLYLIHFNPRQYLIEVKHYLVDGHH